MSDESREEAAGPVTVSLPVMLCRRCVRLVSRHVRDVPGVTSFEVDAAAGLLRVRGGVHPERLRSVLRSAGFHGDRCGHRRDGAR